MKLLVTGHPSCVGPHLVELLMDAGHQVTGVDLDLFADSAFAPMRPPQSSLVMHLLDRFRRCGISSDCPTGDQFVRFETRRRKLGAERVPPYSQVASKPSRPRGGKRARCSRVRGSQASTCCASLGVATPS